MSRYFGKPIIINVITPTIWICYQQMLSIFFGSRYHEYSLQEQDDFRYQRYHDQLLLGVRTAGT